MNGKVKDSEIIQQIRNGNQLAFRDLYDLYFEYAMRVATVVMNHRRADANDAVQETFLRVYQNLDRYDDSRPFKPWFYKILINECHRILKRDGKVISIEILESMKKNEHVSEHSNTFAEYDDLYSAIEHLEHHQRIPIILKYLNGFKEQEIAEIMDANLNTIKSRVFKGKQKLKHFLNRNKEVNDNGRS
ncbi:MAG TPA: RNA polymerase sigma factor [Ureibacillus sp.]|nr:RNA polymerase sigma factor [Ureibacillus sp.]